MMRAHRQVTIQVGRSIFLYLLCLLIFTACSLHRDSHLKDSAVLGVNQQLPEWVTHRVHPKYPDSFYMIGVGFSEKDTREADDAARLDLLKQIEVEIKGEESAVQTEMSQSGDRQNKTEGSTYVQTRVDSKVHMTIPGLNIAERWSDRLRNKYYSLVVLDREGASEYLHEKIKEMSGTINSLVKGGEEAETKRDYSAAINRYQEALKLIRDSQAIISQYKVISGELRESPDTLAIISPAELGIKIAHLSNKVPKTTELMIWDAGIRDLILQVASRVPGEGVLTVVVGDFIEGRSGERVPLSDLIESDIRTTMAQVEDIKVMERDKSSSDLFLTGLFRVDGNVLRINATLKDVETGAIVTAGKVSILGANISNRDLQPHGAAPEKGPQPVSYDTAVEQLLTIDSSSDDTSPFNVRVWTDKTKYMFGEPVTFYFTADRDCYLTLLDQGTSGTLRVIFPNPYQQDNFIRAGKTYAVPDPAANYEIRVDGPAGIERVKAIATLNKSDQPPVDLSKGFYELSLRDESRMRDLTVAVKKLPDQQWTQKYLEIDILSPDDRDQLRPRKLKPKRPDRPVDIIGTPGAIDSGKEEMRE
ncbi:MAG: DUF4384 domain-containing protein [Nitrospirae bacterium]|nr:DUF4384 domain-containing protein [Nitrospirota bacterium]